MTLSVSQRFLYVLWEASRTDRRAEFWTKRSMAVVTKVCSADPKGSSSSSQGIRGYISVMAALKFTCSLN
jgi:hypothetical protein